MLLDKVVKLNNYFDDYGALLTDRQKEIFKLYYHEDLSYQEIADILNISRAGVFDALKRTVEILKDTEEKLGFGTKYDKLFDELRSLNDLKVNEILDNFARGGSYE